MRNIRPLGMLLTALILGVAAAAYASSWIKKQGANSTMDVVVAQHALQMGTRLQPDMLEIIQWPKSAPIQAPITSLAQAVDRVIHMPVLRGEPLLSSKLAPEGEKGGLSSVLTQGQRAVTVKVNEIVGVAGFALPGNYVDVMVNTPDQLNQPVSKIVIERIQVLAVAQDVSSNENKPRVVNAVTLQVTPKQAEQIDLARSIGTLSLVLRSQSDTTSVATEGARKLDLLTESSTLAQASPSTDKPTGKGTTKRVKAPESRPPKSVDNTDKTDVIRGLSLSHE